MSVGLLQACDDPKLLALNLWPEQRKILEQVDSGRFHEVILALGRRSGKSLMAAAVAVHDAAFRDLTAHLRPGERRHVLCVAASREQARVPLDFCRGFVTESPMLAEALVEETVDSLTLRQPRTGALVTIKTVPCNARTTRGLAVSTLIADEMAHWLSDTDGPAVADRVYRALSPAVAQFGDAGRIIVCSTPWGRSGLFYELFTRAESGARPDALAVTAPTWTVNPTLSESYYEGERIRNPETYAGEFGAQFLASGAAFIAWDVIQAAVADDRLELPAGRNHLRGPIAAIDAAFASDPFACAIVGRHPDERDPNTRNRLRLAAVRSWTPRGGELEVEAVLDEVAEMCEYHGAKRVVVDQFCSAPVRQSLARRGLSASEHTMTASSKTAIYSALKSKLMSGELEIFKHETLLAELARIEAVYTAGSASVRIPRVGGSHGDCAQAVALATYELARRGGGGTRRLAKAVGGSRFANVDVGIDRQRREAAVDLDVRQERRRRERQRREDEPAVQAAIDRVIEESRD